MLADAAGAPDRPEPPLGRYGWHHRDRDVRPRIQLGPAEHGGPAGRDAEAERLLDGPVRQVPRGAGVGDESDGPLRRVAERRRRIRALLRVYRRRDQPVRAGDLPRYRPGRAGPYAGGGLPLHRGHDGPRDRVDPPAEGAHGGQALLRLLRTGRHPCPPPRPSGVVGEVQGQVRPGLGQAPRGDVRTPEEGRRDPRGRGADGPAGGDPGLGRYARRHEARVGPRDGGLRRLSRAHGPPRRAADRRSGRPRDPRRHAGVPDHR